jgi:hypothetical protein
MRRATITRLLRLEEKSRRLQPLKICDGLDGAIEAIRGAAHPVDALRLFDSFRRAIACGFITAEPTTASDIEARAAFASLRDSLEMRTRQWRA